MNILLDCMPNRKKDKDSFHVTFDQCQYLSHMYIMFISQSIQYQIIHGGSTHNFTLQQLINLNPENYLYQSTHLLVGFMYDWLGQLKAVANSSLFCSAPITLQ